MQGRWDALGKPAAQRTIKERFLIEELLVRIKYFRELSTEQVMNPSTIFIH
jgi:hypothetical protein